MISMPRLKEKSSSERSWVYEKYIGITQAAHTRVAWDAHRSHLHVMGIVMCIGISWGAHVVVAWGKILHYFLGMCLHHKKLICGHLDLGMSTLFSRSCFLWYSYCFFNTFLSVMIDLESPKDSCMHLTRSKAWE